MVLNGGSSLSELLGIIGGFIPYSCQAAVDSTGQALVSLSRQALLCRHFEVLDQTVQAILALPLDPRVHDVAHYYSAYALHRCDESERIRIVDKLTNNALPEHKPRIILGLAGSYLVAQDFNESSKIYLEAARAATGTDPLAKCQALRGLALIRSFQGDHTGSLTDLERLFPVMRSFAASYPEDYRYYLNNLAYELGEVGRIDEAKAAINVALRSPYADRFPDWAETAQELETKQRRLFLPLVFALSSSAALSSPAAPISPAPALTTPAISNDPAVATRRREQPEPEASASAQPESQPDIQTSAARRISPEPKRNNKSSILVVLAWLSCRRLDRARPVRQSPQPTFEARGCAKSPRARAPPFNVFLFF